MTCYQIPLVYRYAMLSNFLVYRYAMLSNSLGLQVYHVIKFLWFTGMSCYQILLVYRYAMF